MASIPSACSTPDGNDPGGDVAEAKADLSWGEVYETGEETAELAGEIADEVGPEGPFLAGLHRLIARTASRLLLNRLHVDRDWSRLL